MAIRFQYKLGERQIGIECLCLHSVGSLAYTRICNLQPLTRMQG